MACEAFFPITWPGFWRRLKNKIIPAAQNPTAKVNQSTEKVKEPQEAVAKFQKFLTAHKWRINVQYCHWENLHKINGDGYFLNNPAMPFAEFRGIKLDPMDRLRYQEQIIYTALPMDNSGLQLEARKVITIDKNLIPLIKSIFKKDANIECEYFAEIQTNTGDAFERTIKWLDGSQGAEQMFYMIADYHKKLK